MDELRSQIISYNEKGNPAVEFDNRWILERYISQDAFDILDCIKQLPSLEDVLEDTIHFFDGAHKTRSRVSCWHKLNMFDVVSRGAPYKFVQVLAVVQVRMQQSCSAPLLYVRKIEEKNRTMPLRTRIYTKNPNGTTHSMQLSHLVIKHPIVHILDDEQELNFFICTAKNSFPPRRA